MVHSNKKVGNPCTNKSITKVFDQKVFQSCIEAVSSDFFLDVGGELNYFILNLIAFGSRSFDKQSALLLLNHNLLL